jgi:hypothetical protein
LSISSSDFCTDQLAITGSSALISFMACSQLGDARWWCTSMRRGVVCAELLVGKLATAAVATPAAAPASTCRRLTAFAVSGRMQQAQVVDKRRVDVLSMIDSPFYLHDP